MGVTGYFIVNVGGNHVYSLADNVARQALAEPFSQQVGLQIDTSSGAFGLSEQDLALAGPTPLVFDRYYAGHADRTGSLGARWSHSFDIRLSLNGSGAGVIFGSGKEAYFNNGSPSGTFTPADARIHDTLLRNGDGSYSYTTTQNRSYAFNASGVLQRISDLAGNTITFAYSGPGGLLSSVTDPGGRTLTLAYDASSHLSSVSDPTGAVERYTYSAAGDLATATDPGGGVRSYSYSLHRLTGVVDQNGQTLFTNTLDAFNRVTRQTDANWS